MAAAIHLVPGAAAAPWRGVLANFQRLAAAWLVAALAAVAVAAWRALVAAWLVAAWLVAAWLVAVAD